jgi:hypothetical protein
MPGPRTAFLNTIRALSKPELAGGVYCEGWCLTAAGFGVPEHGWVALPDGSLVDPTLSDASNYTEVTRYTIREVAERLKQSSTVPLTPGLAAHYYRTLERS